MHWTEIAERRSGDVVIFDLHGQMTLSGEEALVAVSARIQELLDTTNLGSIIASCPDEAAALRALRCERLTGRP